MNLVVLTTDTVHHSYFLREIGAKFAIRGVLVESSAVKAPFETAHPFEKERDVYESERFFSGPWPSVTSLFPAARTFNSINDIEAIQFLKSLDPTVVVTYGTGRLHPKVIECCPGRILNLHGGDPEEYRGLDSHLWAIYHGDFSQFVVTLHHVNADLDDGAIVSQGKISLEAGMRLYQLRSRNAEICVSLVREALANLAAGQALPARKQARKGRYYSFMPACLKELCVKKFERHTASHVLGRAP